MRVQIACVSLITVGAALGQGLQVKRPSVATVTVSIVTAWGDSIDTQSRGAKIVSFRDREHNRDLAGRFVNGAASNVPLGSYELVVEAEGYERFEGMINVETPRVFLTVGLAWYGLENDLLFDNVFKGTISGKYEGGYCRASGLYLRWQYDALVGSSGQFDFGAVRPGAYSVVCVIDGEPIPFGVVKINASSEPLLFHIPQKSKSHTDEGN